MADIAKVCAGSVEDWLKPGQVIILLWLYPSHAWFFFSLLSIPLYLYYAHMTGEIDFTRFKACQ